MKRSVNAPDCRHAPLARSSVGQVSVCPDCGVVHISLHYLTVRLELAAFGELADMLAQANKRLQDAQSCESPGNDRHMALH